MQGTLSAENSTNNPGNSFLSRKIHASRNSIIKTPLFKSLLSILSGAATSGPSLFLTGGRPWPRRSAPTATPRRWSRRCCASLLAAHLDTRSDAEPRCAGVRFRPPLWGWSPAPAIDALRGPRRPGRMDYPTPPAPRFLRGFYGFFEGDSVSDVGPPFREAVKAAIFLMTSWRSSSLIGALPRGYKI